MSDIAFDLLQQKINGGTVNTEPCLWVVDENISVNDIANVSPSENIQIITNRYDIYRILTENKFNVLLNDFDVASLPHHYFDAIYYRVSKEKAIVHHIIKSSAQWLKNAGKLFISGYKNEGTKTYINKASDYLGECIVKERGAGTSILAQIQYQASETTVESITLDDSQYSTLRVINPDDKITFLSKPGQFGWKKIDQGSIFLMEKIPHFFHQQAISPKRIVDLGCGYGYLSIMTSRQSDAEFIATDNNVAAVNACTENFKRYSINGTVVLTDCADGLNQRADMVICNPPFHQGFSIESDLTLKFLLACQRLLVPGGRALFVVNSFIALERKATDLFTSVSIIDNNKRFKVILLIK